MERTHINPILMSPKLESLDRQRDRHSALQAIRIQSSQLVPHSYLPRLLVPPTALLGRTDGPLITNRHVR